MNNQVIANELLKVAESLTAANVADEEGEYHEFSGKIDFKGNKGDVWDATFDLTSRGSMDDKIGISDRIVTYEC